ncbi:hypothetical protein [[Bacillus] enclensis]|uniref:hypothetical protein n=1 Tax=[Bacillus] enclensis TaxID=1402860 RepID=UPI0018DC51FF|nr:hypothetical protein [[Bacillus] enclensis]MBH9965584.1 hypothetical protein [[Bacillus] enclensis]
MGRRNSGKVRYDGLTQRQQRKLDKKKKFTKRKDSTDWTDRIFAKMKEVDAGE